MSTGADDEVETDERAQHNAIVADTVSTRSARIIATSNICQKHIPPKHVDSLLD